MERTAELDTGSTTIGLGDAKGEQMGQSEEDIRKRGQNATTNAS